MAASAPQKKGPKNRAEAQEALFLLAQSGRIPKWFMPESRSRATADSAAAQEPPEQELLKYIESLETNAAAQEPSEQELLKYIKFLETKGAKVNAPSKDYYGSTSLHVAAAKGHRAAVVALITADAKVNAQNGFGCTPLHVAAQEGRGDAMAALIAARAKVDARSYKKSTPLHGAAYRGQCAAMMTLIAAGAKVNTQDKDGSTPLHEAARGGHADTVMVLIEAGAKDVNTQNKNGYTPLHIAAKCGHSAAVAELIAAGAKVNTQDKDGSTPLHEAACTPKGHSAAAVLIAANANIKVRNKYNHTPLQEAAMSYNDAVVKLLSTAETALAIGDLSDGQQARAAAAGATDGTAATPADRVSSLKELAARAFAHRLLPLTETEKQNEIRGIPQALRDLVFKATTVEPPQDLPEALILKATAGGNNEPAPVDGADLAKLSYETLAACRSYARFVHNPEPKMATVMFATMRVAQQERAEEAEKMAAEKAQKAAPAGAAAAAAEVGLFRDPPQTPGAGPAKPVYATPPASP